MTAVAIIGGGIAGLAAAQRLSEAQVPCILIERDRRVGGKIVSRSIGGFLGGGWARLLSLVQARGRDVGPDPRHRRAVAGDGSHPPRHLCEAGWSAAPAPRGVITGLVPSRLRPLAHHAPALSRRTEFARGSRRLVPRGGGGDESIAQFASRRFGREAYRWVVEPLLSGVYAGDGARLSLSATFPQLARAERTRAGRGAALRLAHAGCFAVRTRRKFLSFPDGVEQLIRSTVARLPATTVRLGVAAQSITAQSQGFHIRCDDGATLSAEQGILATPAFVSAALVEDLSPSLSIELSRIPFVSSATVTLAYADGPAFPGSGYVCPRAEGGPAVAVTWASNKYRGRAPDGGALVRVFFGRAGDEGWVDQPDEVLIAEARQELADVCGVDQAPAVTAVFRWPRGLPQYVIGHLDRMERISALVRNIPGVHLAGASYWGVGIPDCITSGWVAADMVLRAGSPGARVTASRSARLFQEAQALFPGGVNSPVRAFRAVGGHPLFLARGSGAMVEDVDGQRYLDYVLSWGPLILGHAHPLVVRAVQQAALEGTSFGAPTPREIELGRLIQRGMPAVERMRFVNSGTEAVMSALRVARAFTGRSRILKFEGCYHGHADGMLVRAGSGVATLALPDSPGVPEYHRGRHAGGALQRPRRRRAHLRRAPGEHRGGHRRAGGREHGRRTA